MMSMQWPNNTEYGLAAYVFTENYSRVLLAAERLEAGIIGINDPVPATAECPFGGMKKSGIGRECGREGLEAFQEIKFISIGTAECLGVFPSSTATTNLL